MHRFLLLAPVLLLLFTQPISFETGSIEIPPIVKPRTLIIAPPPAHTFEDILNDVLRGR